MSYERFHVWMGVAALLLGVLPACAGDTRSPSRNSGAGHPSQDSGPADRGGPVDDGPSAPAPPPADPADPPPADPADPPPAGPGDPPPADPADPPPADPGDPPPADPPPPPAAGIWHPAPGTSWQWQINGSLDTSVDAAMYDVDLFNTSEGEIAELHAAGRIVVCYFSAGSSEDWRPDFGALPSDAIGNGLDGWPGERWLDHRSEGVRAVMRARLDLAVSKRCDGVEPDNVDGYANDSGFDLSDADQLEYNRWLATEAHARGLSVGLKNDLEQIADLVGSFDWALDEECMQFGECEMLLPFIEQGKAVFHVEYRDGGASEAEVCPRARELGFSTLIKNLDLDAWRISCG